MRSRPNQLIVAASLLLAAFCFGNQLNNDTSNVDWLDVVADSSEVDPRSKDKNDKVFPHWMNKGNRIDPDLLNVQAVVVRDEDADQPCQPGIKDSSRIHMMCAGSILAEDLILTSASCLHETLRIRENIQAPVAVAINVLNRLEIIRMDSYKVHPRHENMEAKERQSPQYARHNVAIMKLQCKMENGIKIELPRQRMSEMCNSGKCRLALLRRSGLNHVIMFQQEAQHIPNNRRKRQSNETSLFSTNATSTIDQENNKTAVLEVETSSGILKGNASTSSAINVANVTMAPMLVSRKEKGENTSKGESINDPQAKEASNETSTQLNNTHVTSEPTVFLEDLLKMWSTYGKKDDPIKSLVTRYSDGTRGCPQTGSPVMAGKVQVGLVAESCDDRQPNAEWRYTELYDNLDWIRSTMKQLNDAGEKSDPASKPDSPTIQGPAPGHECINIYNFFIGYKGTENQGSLYNPEQPNAITSIATSSPTIDPSTSTDSSITMSKSNSEPSPSSTNPPFVSEYLATLTSSTESTTASETTVLSSTTTTSPTTPTTPCPTDATSVATSPRPLCLPCYPCQPCLPYPPCPPCGTLKPCPPCRTLEPCPPCRTLEPCPPCRTFEPCPPCRTLEPCPPISQPPTTKLLPTAKPPCDTIPTSRMTTSLPTTPCGSIPPVSTITTVAPTALPCQTIIPIRTPCPSTCTTPQELTTTRIEDCSTPLTTPKPTTSLPLTSANPCKCPCPLTTKCLPGPPCPPCPPFLLWQPTTLPSRCNCLNGKPEHSQQRGLPNARRNFFDSQKSDDVRMAPSYRRYDPQRFSGYYNRNFGPPYRRNNRLGHLVQKSRRDENEVSNSRNVDGYYGSLTGNGTLGFHLKMEDVKGHNVRGNEGAMNFWMKDPFQRKNTNAESNLPSEKFTSSNVSKELRDVGKEMYKDESINKLVKVSKLSDSAELLIDQVYNGELGKTDADRGKELGL
ncbi:mucin-5AC [Orussus abietinus]|uniref:mucin-5AC n=1 Tax=Orussus abietinus TaxID=222816 RepID=UPI0006266FD1|nr:mucin-5AC [Orussus abietinus]